MAGDSGYRLAGDLVCPWYGCVCHWGLEPLCAMGALDMWVVPGASYAGGEVCFYLPTVVLPWEYIWSGVAGGELNLGV